MTARLMGQTKEGSKPHTINLLALELRSPQGLPEAKKVWQDAVGNQSIGSCDWRAKTWVDL